jgi:hypothetical protein
LSSIGPELRDAPLRCPQRWAARSATAERVPPKRRFASGLAG